MANEIRNDPKSGASRRGEKPWRLEVVLDWFELARSAGLKTAEERLLARRKNKEHRQ